LKKTKEEDSLTVKEKLESGLYGYGEKNTVAEKKHREFISDCVAQGICHWYNIIFKGAFYLESLDRLNELCEGKILAIYNCEFDSFVLSGSPVVIDSEGAMHKSNGPEFKKDFQFRGCKFNLLSICSVYFSGEFLIEGCEIKNKFELRNVSFQKFITRGTTFKGRSLVTSWFFNGAVFEECVFEQEALFQGAVINVFATNAIGAPPMRVLEEGDVKEIDVHTDEPKSFFSNVLFDNVRFEKPELITFESIDFSKADFQLTNLIGVRYLDVKFRQELLNRNGLIHDVRLALEEKKQWSVVINDVKRKYKKASKLEKIFLGKTRRFFKVLVEGIKQLESEVNKNKTKQHLLENNYRNIRMSMEANKDFVIATDFYAGEMDAKRKQLSFIGRNILSVEQLFRLSSNYGQSIKRAICVLSLMLIFQMAFSCWIYSNEPIVDVLEHTVKFFTYQKSDSLGSSKLMSFINSFFRILIPIQVAMLTFAIRNVTRRF